VCIMAGVRQPEWVSCEVTSDDAAPASQR
jgi:hypothetical protein